MLRPRLIETEKFNGCRDRDQSRPGKRCLHCDSRWSLFLTSHSPLSALLSQSFQISSSHTVATTQPTHTVREHKKYILTATPGLYFQADILCVNYSFMEIDLSKYSNRKPLLIRIIILEIDYPSRLKFENTILWIVTIIVIVMMTIIKNWDGDHPYNDCHPRDTILLF